MKNFEPDIESHLELGIEMNQTLINNYDNQHRLAINNDQNPQPIEGEAQGGANNQIVNVVMIPQFPVINIEENRNDLL